MKKNETVNGACGLSIQVAARVRHDPDVTATVCLADQFRYFLDVAALDRQMKGGMGGRRTRWRVQLLYQVFDQCQRYFGTAGNDRSGRFIQAESNARQLEAMEDA